MKRLRSSLQTNVEPGSLEANLNVALCWAWLICALRSDVPGAVVSAAVGLGVTVGVGTALGPGVTVGVGTALGPAVTVGVGKAMTCESANEATAPARGSPPALVKFPAA